MSESQFPSDPIQASPPRKRLFESGQMKLLVLHFISQCPKYSYDLIKDIAALVGGDYKPSTGTIFPTIQYLEKHELIETQCCREQRKQYHITAKGRMHLEQHQDALKKVMDRFCTRLKIQQDEQYVDIKRAMEHLKTSLRLKIKHSELTQEQVRCIADQIDQAAIAISRLEA